MFVNRWEIRPDLHQLSVSKTAYIFKIVDKPEQLDVWI